MKVKELSKKELRELEKEFPVIPKGFVKRFEKGDIVTYSNGVVKCINKPDKYYFYFDSDYYNPVYNQQIVKIQRYVKFLCFYRLKTIYKRK